MKIDFILPDIGEGIVECELVEWRIAEGETITEDQPVADVMTDKALVEITSMYNGVISKLYYQQGDIAKVHQPLFEIEVESEQDAIEETVETIDTETVGTPIKQSKPASTSQCPLATANAVGNKPIASPAVRRLAREMQLDLKAVEGSGKNGRIYKEDLQQHLQHHAQASNDTNINSNEKVTPSQTDTVNKTESIKGIKALMAKQMQDSVSSIPHFTYADELDVTELEATRDTLKPSFEAEGLRLSLMPLFIKALSLALQEHPLLNSRVNEACTEILYQEDHNIGFAVDTPSGLVVPNIKGVQHLTLLDITQEINQLIEAARLGKLTSQQMKGGTITLSNIGVIGGTVATPIINKPEVAIVALGKIQKLPRFDENDQVVARKIMQISWSGDHRIIDGASMARFCNTWKAYLENPISMLTKLR
ncbi:2-oxo acid dehydrogenase subunit E2 [Nitrincola schmidtii]|uniref:2-oxo acid dehydrogenase subunit E2 n=1 Tax=Nitrincola schmidtii TaxID=1730894 RepID=UPI00124F501A|nr:2-oxo acid dehydrogenase subunit E2 [Nitrincola schmidtii]